MGEVYEGENVSIRRRVAIKVLLGEAAMNADIVQRFEREAQAAGRIGNDHILEVLDLGVLPTGDRFMVMEFLDGEPLNSRIERLHQLTAEQATPLVLQALTGLAAAHRAGIIHRDLKPENLFVLKQKAGVSDFVKIIDFGISKFSQLSNEGMKMTKTGSVMGTPYYMSPEQANGSREADARSDLYAMGVILYECITGAVPFDGKTFNELLFKIVLSDAPLARQLAPNLDPAFEAIISKAMARDVAQRYQTCEEFAQALRDFQAGLRGSSADVTGRVSTVVASAPGLPPPTARVGLSTGANWSNTGMQLPKRRNAPLIAAMLGGGALILGGGAFAAFKVMHESPATSAASAGANADVASKAPATALTPPPEVPAPPAPANTAEAPLAATASAAPSAKPPEPTPSVKPAPAVRSTFGGRTPARPAVAPPPTAAATPAPPPPPPPAPVAAPKKKSSSSNTDFGY